MRVGIMGGTLDPVHNGHVQLAVSALEFLNLDRVMLLPAGDPPHKLPPTPKEDRLEMARLAAETHESLFACSIEVFRSGTTYTVDTLKELRSKNPGTEWFYIVGADTLDVLDTWRNFGEVAKLCTFAVVGRADENVSKKRMQELGEQYGASFIVLPVNGPDISSTDVRNRAAEGLDISDIVPTAVCNYITDHGLYLSRMRESEIIRSLKETLKPSRMEHTLGVVETARRLAARYGIAPARAAMAALLHDCAKYMPPDEMRSLIQKYIPDWDEFEMKTASVLHAPAGAVLAAQKFGIRDKSILSAIRKHTIGDPEMSPLDALIYTADFIEPGRREFPGLCEARTLAETNIFAAMCKCAELTNDYLEQQGKQPHPKALAMLEKYSK